MITESEIRDKLVAYLSRSISLNQFEDWLAQRSWNMHRDSEPAARKLVGALELRLAEYSDGHLTDEGLERELSGLLPSSVLVRIGDSGTPLQPHWTGATASESFRVSVTVEAQPG